MEEDEKWVNGNDGDKDSLSDIPLRVEQNAISNIRVFRALGTTTIYQEIWVQYHNVVRKNQKDLFLLPNPS